MKRVNQEWFNDELNFNENWCKSGRQQISEIFFSLEMSMLQGIQFLPTEEDSMKSIPQEEMVKKKMSFYFRQSRLLDIEQMVKFVF